MDPLCFKSRNWPHHPLVERYRPGGSSPIWLETASSNGFFSSSLYHLLVLEAAQANVLRPRGNDYQRQAGAGALAGPACAPGRWRAGGRPPGQPARPRPGATGALQPATPPHRDGQPSAAWLSASTGFSIRAAARLGAAFAPMHAHGLGEINGCPVAPDQSVVSYGHIPLQWQPFQPPLVRGRSRLPGINEPTRGYLSEPPALPGKDRHVPAQ